MIRASRAFRVNVALKPFAVQVLTALVVLSLVRCSDAPAASVLPTVLATATATASPTPTPTATPAPTVRGVSLKASEFILPLNELPVSGLKVVEDLGTDLHWRRYWDPIAPIGARYFYVLIEVSVYPSTWSPSQVAALALPGLRCEATRERGGFSNNQPPTSAVQITAAAVGDAAQACGYGFASGFAHLEYVSITRNVLIFVQVGPSTAVSQSEAMDQAVAIARRQIEVLDRVAPR